MATFNDMLITNNGKLIYAKAMAGKTVTFSGVKFGSGKASSITEAESLTDLKNTQITGAIESVTSSSDGAIVVVGVNNSSLSSPLGIREIGLFCLDPDTQVSTMYAYAYSDNDIDVIPASASGSVTWKMTLKLAITNVNTSTTTQQTEVMSFTPVVTPTATDSTVFVSEVVKSAKYVTKGDLITVMYNISGKLTNMALYAETKLSRLTISLPKACATALRFTAPMEVVSSEATIIVTVGQKIMVDVLARIDANSNVIDIDYFGLQNGTFTFNFEITYMGV